jgi:hypothetical protein
MIVLINIAQIQLNFRQIYVSIFSTPFRSLLTFIWILNFILNILGGSTIFLIIQFLDLNELFTSYNL